MGKKIEYQSGQIVGGCAYLKEVDPYVNPNGRKVRKAQFKCACGKIFTTTITSITTGNTKSCGCLHVNRAKTLNLTHGLSQHPLYQRWVAMKRRCYDQKYSGYKYYGIRGITMYSKWIYDFKSYFDYVMSLENAMRPGLTIDRENNDGNYEPGNLRWATKHVQAANQGKRRINTSGYTGVWFNKCSNKWESGITVNRNRIYLGKFELLMDAVIARREYINENNLQEYPTNTKEIESLASN